jgi:5-(carboxyamino)imidazole ribonucleotide mutase
MAKRTGRSSTSAKSSASKRPAQSGAGSSFSRLKRIGDGTPIVAIVMGSKSDWETMAHASKTLADLGVAHEVGVVSAHRTPDWLFSFADAAEARGLEVVIAGAGGAAHLPGMIASKTIVPVLGVPVQSHALSGMDSLLSIVQMPGGVPVGTLAIGKAGAINAALLATAIVSASRPAIRERLRAFRTKQTASVLEAELE